jgi:hypothetical protein
MTAPSPFEHTLFHRDERDAAVAGLAATSRRLEEEKEVVEAVRGQL